MNTFKVGDKVRRTRQPHPRFQIGYEGVVTGISNNGCWISVDNYRNHYDASPLNPSFFELIETEETQMTTPVLKNMKIRIKDAIHSRMVQEALFEMGCDWVSCGKEVLFADSEVLWVDDGIITKSDMSIFNSYHPNEEVELVTTYTFKPVDQEAKRKAAEKEALSQDIIKLQQQLDEMKQKLESI